MTQSINNPNKPFQSFRDLEIWQLGISIVKKIYKITQNYPDTEQFILISQTRRSAISIPSNIAEGSRRNSPIEFQRFLNISLGSLAELETQLIVAYELGYIREEAQYDLLEHIDHISRKTSNLLKHLRHNAERLTQNKH